MTTGIPPEFFAADIKTSDYYIDPSNHKYSLFELPKLSEWKCHLFGSDGTNGITYQPVEGKVPNWFIRWMMKICLGCTWVKTP